MTEIFLSLFLTASQGWGFESGAGAAIRCRTPYLSAVVSATTQQKSAVMDGYTYSGTLQLSPAWKLAPTIGVAHYGYTGTWAKHTTEPTVGLRWNIGELTYLTDSRTWTTEFRCPITDHWHILLGLEYNAAIDATGYAAGIAWRK